MSKITSDLGTANLNTHHQTRYEARGPAMTTNERDERTAGITQAAPTQPDSGDPRDTNHPTGSQQAAENAANDPPS
jgi:hypothetical protein